VRHPRLTSSSAGLARLLVEHDGVNLFSALQRTSDDEFAQPSDEELLAWAEELRSTNRPKRKHPLVAAPID